jgi:hypothetical protein
VGGLEVANSVEDPGSSGFWRLRWEDEEERKQGSRAVRLCLEPSRVVLRTGFFLRDSSLYRADFFLRMTVAIHDVPTNHLTTSSHLI